MCMNDLYMLLTLLVPGPNDPTKNLNVYLRPLNNELVQLWNISVRTYDTSTKTITDFPGLTMVSGWSTKEKLACHVCKS